ncbi:sensor histidine kinase [Paenibacillus sp. JX-17]|uniref:histidine kinase n=1 Tax=Paenibacillus lacisoli TaxID=3064525 RepID=A0ABT9CAJ7_9BACL|nr:sensor histidine kinase [Paenibacillus sp. JX-17]MDO7906271.1 sensor histidine kinase [Paenibacillus sp. JX-17]
MSLLWWLMLLVVLIILVLYLREHTSHRALRRDLTYINQKMTTLNGPGLTLTRERVQIVTGVQELRELLQGLNTLLDHARQSSADYIRTEQAMRRMLANVSHDLKTPLTVIMGYTEFLTGPISLSPEEQQRMLGQVHRKALELHELIHAFFDLSRLEADDYDLPLTPLDACEVCRHRILAYYDLLAEQGFEVQIAVPEHPVWVYANEEALSRILDNLLSNAVRYGADGRYLGLSLTCLEQNVHIQVADRGAGIARSEQARVFERMYTMEDSRNRRVQGSGLGLTIAQRLTERMNGKLSLDSEPGAGARFTLTLPASTYRKP